MTRTRTFTARIAVVAVAMISLSALVPTSVQATTLTPRTRMYRATNNTRVDYGVPRVGIHDVMSKLALRHSIAMANKGYIFHTANPAGYYLKGTSWRTWGENVGVTSSTVWSIQHAFMNSPPHRSNILNRAFHRVAVGTYRDANGFLWVTVFFYG
jgi:uncharacterized protein YkwD